MSVVTVEIQRRERSQQEIALQLGTVAMSVEIFSRDEFEKAIGFFPYGFKCIGAESGQLEYKAPVMSTLICAKCGVKFVPAPGYTQARCPNCSQVAELPKGALVPGEVYIKIYSSIDYRTGVSRDTGEDSIRFVLIDKKGKPLGKIGHYTTRLPGWEARVKDKCREMWSLALKIPHCKKGHLGRLGKCRSGENKGRIFAKCYQCNEWLGWVDKS